MYKYGMHKWNSVNNPLFFLSSKEKSGIISAKIAYRILDSGSDFPLLFVGSRDCAELLSKHSYILLFLMAARCGSWSVFEALEWFARTYLGKTGGTGGSATAGMTTAKVNNVTNLIGATNNTRDSEI
jgi:hypothetical protein